MKATEGTAKGCDAPDLGELWPAALRRQGAMLGDVLPACAAALTSALGRPGIADADPTTAATVTAPVGSSPRHIHGAPAAAATASAGPSAPGVIQFDPTDRICVIVVDGLGALNLAERGGHAPTLRAASQRCAPIGVAYPTTTACDLAFFGTGAWPGSTAMLGYTVRNPMTGTLANVVQWRGLPDAQDWQRVPTVFERLTAVGVPVTAIGPARFSGSGMNEAVLRGARFQAAESLDDRVRAALNALREPGLVYLYWGDVDKAGHHHGWQSREWSDQLEVFDGALAALLRSMPAGALTVVTADHGMIDVDRSLRWDVAHDSILSDGVALVSGEPRATYLHVKEGVDPSEVAARWRDRLGEHAAIWTKEDAISQGLFGPVVTALAHAVIGDVVVAMLGRATVVDSATQTPASLDLVGVHGGLTPQELTVPLLTWRR